MSFKPFYLSEVLGVKKYLCPERVFSLRHIKGSLPCDVLVVTQEEVNSKEQTLLRKIIQSIGFSDYALMELKDLNFLDSFMNAVEKEWLARFVLFFGRELSYKEFKRAQFISACSLSELEGGSSEAQVRKKELWQELKKWKQN